MGDFKYGVVMRKEIVQMVKAHAIYLNYLLGKEDPHWESQRITPFFASPRDAKIFAYEKRKAAILRAMSGKVKSEARGKVITARKAFPRLVTKRVNAENVRD